MFGRNQGALRTRDSAPFRRDGEEAAKIAQNMELLAISTPSEVYLLTDTLTLRDEICTIIVGN